MRPKHLRFILATVLFGFLFVFLVPLVYDATMIHCRTGSGINFGFCPIDRSGLKSIGYTLLGRGGVYSFGTAEYSFLPEASFILGASALTNYGILQFFALPIATAAAGLLAPETIRRTRVAGLVYGVLGLLMLSIAVSWFRLAGLGLTSALLGTSILMVGFAIIVFPLYKWTISVTCNS